MGTTSVFISYSSKDSRQAYRIYKLLQKEQIHCWIAPDSLSPGGNYAAEITNAIDTCTHFLLILSAHSQASQHVQREIEIAVSFNKTIIPIQIDNSSLNVIFRYHLAGCQIISCTEISEQSANFQKVIKIIKQPDNVSLIQRIVTTEMRWIFREQSNSRMGTDAYIELCEENNANILNGRMIAAHILIGKHYFDESDTDNIICHFDKENVNYWNHMILPVIVILLNPETNECIWESVDEMENGEKLLVPKKQVFSVDSKKKLMRIANMAPFDRAVQMKREFMEMHPSSIWNSHKNKASMHSEDKNNYVAIDFGSSNSMFGYMDTDGNIVHYKSQDKKVYFPTAVAFDKNYHPFVAADAMNKAKDPDFILIRNFKRELGKNKKYQVFHLEITAEDLTVLYLSMVLQDISERYSTYFDRCYISMSCSFSMKQREAYRKCIQKCDLKIVRCVMESDCPGLIELYKLFEQYKNEGEELTVLIIDIGGGTTDISIAALGYGITEILSSDGLNTLGGFDFDRIIQEYLFDLFQKQYPHIEFDRLLEIELISVAEKIKMELNDKEIVIANINNCYNSILDEYDICTLQISRKEVSERLIPLITQIEACIDEVMKKNGDNDIKIEEIILGGAAGQLFIVMELLTKRYPGIKIKSDKNDKLVFQGLVLQAGRLDYINSCTKKEYLLLCSTSEQITIKGEELIDFREIEKKVGSDYYYYIEKSSDAEVFTDDILMDYATTIPTKSVRKYLIEKPQLIEVNAIVGNIETKLFETHIDHTEFPVTLEITASIDTNQECIIEIYMFSYRNKKKSIVFKSSYGPYKF